MCKCTLRPHCTISYLNDTTHDLHAPPRCFSDCRLRCLTLAEWFSHEGAGKRSLQARLTSTTYTQKEELSVSGLTTSEQGGVRDIEHGGVVCTSSRRHWTACNGASRGKCSPNRSPRRQATPYGTGTRSHRGDMEGSANSKPVATCL